MILDTSSLIAILFGEPEQAEFADIVDAAPVCLASAVTWYETVIVARGRKGDAILGELGALRKGMGLVLVPFDEAQAAAAIDVYRRFGKGVHPAALNFADCCSYALARTRNMPLLFKGDDFSRTDIPSAAALWARRGA